MRPAVSLLLAALASPAFASPFTTAEINRQIDLDHACIRQADRQMETQREIGRESGVFDRHAVYVAGMNKVQCKRHIQALLTCSQRDMCEGLTPGTQPDVVRFDMKD